MIMTRSYAFFGTNPDDFYDLGGEVELWLGDEKHIHY